MQAIVDLKTNVKYANHAYEEYSKFLHLKLALVGTFLLVEMKFGTCWLSLGKLKYCDGNRDRGVADTREAILQSMNSALRVGEPEAL